MLIIEIRNSKDSTQRSGCCEAWGVDLNARPWSLLGQIGAPLEAFWSAGHESVTGRNRNALALLSRVYADKVDFRRIVFDDSGAVPTVHTDPLNWSLTPAQQREVDESAKNKISTALYECARKWFGASQNAWKDRSSEDAARLSATCPAQ